MRENCVLKMEINGFPRYGLFSGDVPMERRSGLPTTFSILQESYFRMFLLVTKIVLWISAERKYRHKQACNNDVATKMKQNVRKRGNIRLGRNTCDLLTFSNGMNRIS